MSYRAGFCGCCDCEIAQRDTDGRLCRTLPSYRNIYVVFERPSNGDKSRMAVAVCKECIAGGGLSAQTLYERCLASGEEAAKDYEKQGMIPVGIEQIHFVFK